MSHASAQHTNYFIEQRQGWTGLPLGICLSAPSPRIALRGDDCILRAIGVSRLPCLCLRAIGVDVRRCSSCSFSHQLTSALTDLHHRRKRRGGPSSMTPRAESDHVSSFGSSQPGDRERAGAASLRLASCRRSNHSHCFNERRGQRDRDERRETRDERRQKERGGDRRQRIDDNRQPTPADRRETGDGRRDTGDGSPEPPACVPRRAIGRRGAGRGGVVYEHSTASFERCWRALLLRGRPLAAGDDAARREVKERQ